LKYPKKLKAGDTIGLLCPSSPTKPEREELCKAFVRDLGYKIKAADNLSASFGGYMAGTGEVRGKWINAMFADPEVNAIICIKGGSSSSRAMEFLDLETIKKNPKIFVGYSDITNFHTVINQFGGFVTFHGPMVSSNMLDNKFDEETKNSLFHALNADEDYDLEKPANTDISVIKPGKARGILAGGCLSLLCASVGTPYEIDTRGKIIFLEDVNEDVYRIDRFASQLRDSGKFRDCAGVLLGQFADCKNREKPEFTPVECLADILKDANVPVISNVQSGHGFPMMTLPFGAECSIDTVTKTVRFHVDRS